MKKRKKNEEKHPVIGQGEIPFTVDGTWNVCFAIFGLSFRESLRTAQKLSELFLDN